MLIIRYIEMITVYRSYLVDVLKALKSYHYLLQLGTFNAAAEKLGLANSAITRHVQELEKHLCCELLKRTTRTFQLTPEGEKLKKIAHSVLFQLENMRVDLAQVNDLKGELTFLVDPLLTQFVYSKCLAFQSISDEIIIHQHTLYENFLLEMKPFDIALTVQKVASAHKFHVQTSETHQFQFGWYAGPHYLQCEGLPADMGSLKDHTVIIYDHPIVHSSLQTLKLDQTLTQANILTTNNIEIARQLLLDNKGIALMPHNLIEHDVEEGFVTDLKHLKTPSSFSLYVVRPKENRYSLLLDAIAGEFL